MIVAFAVDPGALALPARDAGVRLAAHERLLRWWAHLGILVYPGDRLRSTRLYEAISELPVDLRKRWAAAFQVGWHSGAQPEVDLSTVESASGLSRMKGHVTLACLDEQRALKMGLPVERPCRVVPKAEIEICRLECVDATDTFQRSERLADGWIDAGTSVDEVWQIRFSRMSRWASQVVIVDRYGALQHARAPHRSGFRRLLTELDRDGPGARVHIYSEVGRVVSADRLAEALGAAAEEFTWRGLQEITLTLVSENHYWEIAHDRYIRFDQKLCSVGVGLCELLSGDEVTRRSTFRLMRHGPESRDLERRLTEKEVATTRWTAPLTGA